MGKREVKTKYKQPHSINVRTGNEALDSKLTEKAHHADKRNAKQTNKEIRAKNRIKDIIDLGNKEKLYCKKHGRYLCIQDLEERKCYQRHSTSWPPQCPNLWYENIKGVLRPYKK